MSKNLELDGVGTNIQFGKSGPRLKHDSNKIQIRNSADDDFTNVKVDIGVNDNHAINKSQFDQLKDDAFFRIYREVTYTDSGQLTISDPIEANSIITQVIVYVDTDFDDPAATITIGTTSNDSAVQSATAVNLFVPAVYKTDTYFDVGSSATQMALNINPGTSSKGICQVSLIYCIKDYV